MSINGQFVRGLAGFAGKVPRPAGKHRLPDVSKIVAVASGKGGVGKSTTAGILPRPTLPSFLPISLTCNESLSSCFSNIFSSQSGPNSEIFSRLKSPSPRCIGLYSAIQAVRYCWSKRRQRTCSRRPSSCRTDSHAQGVHSKFDWIFSCIMLLISSWCAVNLAVSLANKFGLRVGLLDADVFGPSIPRMMHLSGKPAIGPGIASCHLLINWN